MKFILAALCCVFLASLSLAGESGIPESPQSPSELNWTRRTVPFDHSAHLRTPGAASCISCHHSETDETYYRSCADAGCHDNLDPRDVSPQSYHLAVHKQNPEQFASCVSCHTQEAGDDLERLKLLTGCRNSVCHR
jgi:hypothetical protein